MYKAISSHPCVHIPLAFFATLSCIALILPPGLDGRLITWDLNSLSRVGSWSDRPEIAAGLGFVIAIANNIVYLCLDDVFHRLPISLKKMSLFLLMDIFIPAHRSCRPKESSIYSVAMNHNGTVVATGSADKVCSLANNLLKLQFIHR
jgi:hypothetical protein